MLILKCFNIKVIKLVSSLLMSLLISLLSFNSYADHITDCTLVEHGDITNYVSNTSGCELGQDDQDFLNPTLMVNSDGGMFGHTDWEFITKYEGGQSGTFELDGVVPVDVLIMLVFKGPNANSGTQPDLFVGYLLSEGESIFDWATMFAKQNNNSEEWNFQGVSHLSLYWVADGGGGPQCTECNEVPEPQTLFLFAAGLLGIYYTRRKLQKP